MSRKRVAIIAEDLAVGGLERVVEEIVLGLRPRVDFTVVCLRAGGAIFERLRASGIPAHVLPVRGLFDVSGMRRLIAFLRAGHFDVVHTHGVSANVLGTGAAYAASVRRVVSHIHTLTVAGGVFVGMKEFLLNAAGRTLVFCSQAAEKSYRQAHRVAVSQCRVIYNGVDVDRFSACAAASGYPVVFGCLASFAPHKGHAVLLDAVRILQKKGAHCIVRCAGSGSLAFGIQDRVATEGLSSWVVFDGQVVDVCAFMGTVDAVLLPSVGREGLGIALIEAMAAGKPTVGSDLGGIPEVIENGVTGFLVPQKDAAALADAMQRLIADEALRTRMGAAGKDRCRAMFSLETMLAKVEECYA